jgi:hypothetical protein
MTDALMYQTTSNVLNRLRSALGLEPAASTRHAVSGPEENGYVPIEASRPPRPARRIAMDALRAQDHRLSSS